MLAGGAEASLCEVGIASFNAIRALSTRNDEPEKASRPFDKDRDGFVPGEGAGVLVLEDLYTEYRFPRTALLMAHARGVICLAARQRNVAVLPLAPAEVKRAVAANGAASKEQMQRCVQRVLGLRDLPTPSHVADALALALTGFSRLGGRLQ